MTALLLLFLAILGTLPWPEPALVKDTAIPSPFVFPPSNSPQNDAYVLARLKAALVPTNAHSHALSDWDPAVSSPGHCSFSGVTCDANARVIAISLVSLPLDGGSLPPELALLPTLINLTIADCMIVHSIPPSLQALPSLRLLNLSQNYLTGPFPSTTKNSTYFPSLQVIDLYDNKINSILPPFGAAQTHLRFIDLRNNSFFGFIPESYGDLLALKELDLSYNSLYGQLPASLGRLAQLERMVMGFNNFSGSIPSDFGKLVSLTWLVLPNCNLTGSIPPELGRLPHLRRLKLFSNQLSGKIPPQLGDLDNLSLLDLSNNALTGPVPQSFSNLTKIKFFMLQANRLSGELLAFDSDFPRLVMLSLSNNDFTGHLPTGLLRNGTILRDYFIAENKLTGPIPPELCTWSKVRHVDLVANSLSGTIPESLGNCNSLVQIKLGKNQLSGSVPVGLFNLPKAWILDLEDNQLTGELPNVIGGEKMLQMFLSRNGFSGSIPPAIGNLRSLQKLDLSLNNFSGTLPPEICGGHNIIMLNGRGNAFTGSIPSVLLYCRNLTILDLSNNKLSGKIPDDITSLKFLRKMNLSRNQLSSEIPLQISNMTELIILDVSYNRLSGPVPEHFRMKKEWFVGNPGLCGDPFPNKCNDINEQRHSKKKLWWLLLLLLLIPISVCIAVCGKKCWRDRNAWKMVLRQGTQNFSVEEVLHVMEDELNRVGGGGEGTVYHGVMNCGLDLAIKRFTRPRNGRNNQGFDAEVKTLMQITHRNIVRLIGHISNLETKIVLYEYMPNGSLHDRLHGNQLDNAFLWNSRINNAAEVARALKHMHHGPTLTVIHRDIKSQNILLDSNFEAHVGDFGLAAIISIGSDHISGQGRIMGTPGYIPPEYHGALHYDTKGDIYSFGVVLLELITGRCATLTPTGTDEPITLVGWVGEQTNKIDSFFCEWNQIDSDTSKTFSVIDQRLPPPEPVEPIVQLYNLAMECVSNVTIRPSMLRVVDVLDDIAGAQVP